MPRLSTNSVFLSYSRVDDAHRQEIKRRLNEHIPAAFWDDHEIEAGTQWQAAITTALDDCVVAILLISPTFVASSFVQNVEASAFQTRQARDGIGVVPILLRQADLTRIPWLPGLQILPNDQTGLNQLDEPAREAAMASIVRQAREIWLVARVEVPLRLTQRGQYLDAAWSAVVLTQPVIAQACLGFGFAAGGGLLAVVLGYAFGQVDPVRFWNASAVFAGLLASIGVLFLATAFAGQLARAALPARSQRPR